MLEHEIKELTAAVKALTAALEAERGNARRVEHQTVETIESVAPDDVAAPAQGQGNEAPFGSPTQQELKDATLKASRAGHKDAIRKKLSEYNVTTIQALGSHTDAFYGWVLGLGCAE